MRILQPQWAQLFGKIRRRRRGEINFKPWQVLLLFVILAFLSYALLAPRDNIVTVEAITETASYTVTNAELSRINIHRARLVTDPLSVSAEQYIASIDSELRVHEGTRVRLTKREGARKAYLTLVSNDGSVGQVINSGEVLELGPWASLEFDTADDEFEPIVIPFRGSLSLGEDVAVGVAAILLSGSVSIAEEQLGVFNQERYLLQRSEFEQGDRIQIKPRTSEGNVVSDGFLRISGQAAATVVAHSSNCEVHIVRFGSGGYKITPSAWVRLTSDPGLSWLTALLGILLLSIELILALSSFSAGRMSPRVDDPDKGN